MEGSRLHGIEITCFLRVLGLLLAWPGTGQRALGWRRGKQAHSPSPMLEGITPSPPPPSAVPLHHPEEKKKKSQQEETSPCPPIVLRGSFVPGSALMPGAGLGG